MQEYTRPINESIQVLRFTKSHYNAHSANQLLIGLALETRNILNKKNLNNNTMLKFRHGSYLNWICNK